MPRLIGSRQGSWYYCAGVMAKALKHLCSENYLSKEELLRIKVLLDLLAYMPMTQSGAPLQLSGEHRAGEGSPTFSELKIKSWDLATFWLAAYS